ncbi:hypothetical protein K502DRAFT_361374 [Neoconidiobolus thromboides FSU 785]|nr:hypothetical protein K502DRAFT_361374 [Neoconidiobolus thromboides FSU 785]
MKLYSLLLLPLVSSIPLDASKPGKLVAQLIADNNAVGSNAFIRPPPPPPPRPQPNNIRIRNDVRVSGYGNDDDDKHPYNPYNPYNPFDPYNSHTYPYDPSDPQPPPPVFPPIVLNDNQQPQPTQTMNPNPISMQQGNPGLNAQQDMEIAEIEE